MRRLTTKQNFAAIFGIYVFFSLVILIAIFIGIFYFITDYQLKRDLYLESTDIINNHLFLENKSLTFKKDQTGASLRDQLLTHDSTAVFLDSGKNLLRSYGIFSLTDDSTNINFLQMADTAKSQGSSQSEFKWRGQSMASLTIPLKKNGEIVGFMIIGKSLEESIFLKQMMIIIFFSVGILGLAGSFLVGYLFAKRALQPLSKMTKAIEGMELDNLDKIVVANGHPQDELVRLGERFNEMIERLRDMADRQKAFITNASHELKTPLTRAISSLELLSLVPFQDKQEVKAISNELFAINNLLEKLLLLTKLKKDVQKLQPYQLDLAEFIKNLRTKFDKQWDSHNLHFVANTPPQISLTIPKEYFLIIIINLISNSTKYSKNGGSIFFNISILADGTMITISDEGVGISEEGVKHMFDRFYREKNDSGSPGYGIGLSVVKQICDIYHIHINVSSQKEKGTTITLNLPLS